MKVEVKKIDAVKRELRFEVPKDRVSRKFNEVYQELGKIVKVKGFRSGKVPRHILEARHRQAARDEVFQKLIPEIYHEGIQRENLIPLDLPDIADVSLKDGIVTFTAKLDIKPEVNIEGYKGLKVTRKSASVTPEELAKTLDYFKQAHGRDKEGDFDDVFARGLGYPSLEEMKKSLIRQIELDKERQARADIENQIVDALLKKVKLTAPQSLVRKQIDRRIHEWKHRAKDQGLSKEDIAGKEKTMSQELQAPVERDIKAYLIMDKIAALENIDVKEGNNMPSKVMEFLLKEAKWEEA